MKRTLTLLVALIAVGSSTNVPTQGAESFSLFRYLGIGWGDGYHAYDGCRGYCGYGGYQGEAMTYGHSPHMNYVPSNQHVPQMNLQPTPTTPITPLQPAPMMNSDSLPPPARSAHFPQYPRYPIPPARSGWTW